MKVDQNRNAYTYRVSEDGRKRSKTHQNENDELKDRKRMCSTYVTTCNYRFSNVLVWRVENAS